MKALINVVSYDFHEFNKNVYILFDDVIREVGQMNDFYKVDKNSIDTIIDGSGSMVLPGLINGHTHIYSTLARGIELPFNPKSFKDILDQLWWKFDRVLEKEDCYISGLVYGIESIKCGVTTLIDHHASGSDIVGTLKVIKKAICDDLGMRGVFCFETSDRFDLNKCIEENTSFSKASNSNYCGIFGMHASMSLSEESLVVIHEKKGTLPIHVHVAESIEDVADSLLKYDKTVIERFNDHNILASKSILAHCVHINETEARLLKESNAFVALNPTSNMNNCVGLPDWKLLKKYAVPCIVGTDGLGSNIVREFLNLNYTMKNKYKEFQIFTLEDLREVISNSYNYVSQLFNIKIGRIQNGYVSDFVVVPYNAITEITNSNVFSHVFYGLFDNFKPKDVFCNGVPLMENYKLYADEKEIHEKSLLISSKIWNKLK
jgi:cytosine/adenosine deaminase-related metal-dependent hydrolase